MRFFRKSDVIRDSFSGLYRLIEVCLQQWTSNGCSKEEQGEVDGEEEDGEIEEEN